MALSACLSYQSGHAGQLLPTDYNNKPKIVAKRPLLRTSVAPADNDMNSHCSDGERSEAYTKTALTGKDHRAEKRVFAESDEHLECFGSMRRPLARVGPVHFLAFTCNGNQCNISRTVSHSSCERNFYQ